jgi:hypothetical protein
LLDRVAPVQLTFSQSKFGKEIKKLLGKVLLADRLKNMLTVCKSIINKTITYDENSNN